MTSFRGLPYSGVSSSQENGQMSFTSADGIEEYSTLMCVHCQFHMRVRIGSGKDRGFCMRCMGVLCGKKRCLEHCEPFARAIERMEGRLSLAAKMDQMVTGASE